MEPIEMSAYKGDKPYIFVSYAHKDADTVIPLIKALQDFGYRIWFDLGIEVGTEWSNNIANHLRDCSAFLFFASQNSVKSENCLDEVAYAKSHNKSAVLVFLEEDVILPAGTEMQTARFQRMYVNRQTDIQSFVKNFSEAKIFDACREDGEFTAPVNETPIIQPQKAEATDKKFNLKLSKGALIGIAAAVLAVIVAILIIIFAGGEKDDSADKNKAPEVVTLSNELSDHTFKLEGKVYKLPLKYSKLVDDGWTIHSIGVSGDDYIGGLADTAVTLVKDGKTVNVLFYNDGEHAKKLKDCYIGGIGFYKGDPLDFCIAAEVNLEKNNDEIIEIFGTPSEYSENENSALLTWSFGENSEVNIRIYDGEDAKYSYINLENYVFSKEKTEPKKEAPKFLDDYSAPVELGEKLYSAIFSLEGDLYELPLPLREFLNNGWKIASGSGAIVSGGKEYYELTKDGAKISVEVLNPSFYKTLPENCIVTRVSCEKEDNADFSLPLGVAIGISEKQFKSVAPKTLEVYEGSYSNSYSYSEYKERNFYLSITVDSGTKEISRISMNNSIDGFITDK